MIGAAAATVPLARLAAAKPTPAGRGPNAGRPNILIIMGDDATYKDLALYGGRNVKTPNIDRLATEGVVFENAFLSIAMCNPCRTELYTGLYPARNGSCWNHSAARPGTRSIVHYLGDLGYRVGLCGKKHVGPAKAFPFEKVPGVTPGCTHPNPQFSTAGMAAFMGRDARQPFCLVAGLIEPHAPWTVGRPDHFKPNQLDLPPFMADTKVTRTDYAKYLAEIEVLDTEVGAILGALDASGQADRTLVIFTAEHGIAYPGAKWCLREPGLRIPYIVHRPGTPMAGGKVYHDLMSHVDFLPTLLGLVGVPVPENVQGMSFAPLLLGKPDKGPRRYVFGHRQPHARRENVARSVRDERLKLIRCFENDRVVQYPTDAVPIDVSRHTARPQRKGARPFAELFDLKDDPNELHNLSGEAKHADVLKRLNEALYAWMQRVNDPLLNGPIATPYYKAAMEDFRTFAPGGRALS